MVNKRGPEGGRVGAWHVAKKYFRVSCVARRGFLCVYNVLDDEEHCVMFVVFYPSPNTHTHTAHPGQEWRRTSRVCTQAHTHPTTPARSGGAQPKPEPRHTPTPHTPARSGRAQAERAQKHRPDPTPLTRSRGGPATGRCGDTHRRAGRQGTTLTRASIRSCHVTKRFRILATLQRGNKSMYNNTSEYVHMGLRLDWGKGITGQ